MTCARFVDTEAAERYVIGQMTEAEQSAFEEHYFACDECFQSVQALQDLQAVLRETPAAHASEDEAKGPAVPSVAPSAPSAATAVASTAPRPATAPVPITAGRRKTWSSPVTWVGLAAAASVLLALIVWQRQPEDASAPAVIAKNEPAQPTEQPPATQTPSTPAPSTERPPSATTAPPDTPGAPGTTAPAASAPRTEPVKPAAPPARSVLDFGALAMVVPPAYVPLQTRGAESTQADRFQSAMALYAAKDYRGAIEGLRPIAEADPSDGRTQFFLGVSYLMTNETAAANSALERSVASADAPFATEAHFYLAKAALREKDLARAEKELATAAEQEAGPPGEAARLLRLVRQARVTTPER